MTKKGKKLGALAARLTGGHGSDGAVSREELLGRIETWQPTASPHQLWHTEAMRDVHIKSELGMYRIRGFAMFRRAPSLDDLVILPGVLTRFPIEGYKEYCGTDLTLGGLHGAARPLQLAMPVLITGMSYGALNRTAKVALGRAASALGIPTCTGDGGMLPEEREASKQLIYQILPSRFGQRLADLLQADALEIVTSQGAKPGTGGLLLGSKVSEHVASMRTLPVGVDQRSPTRHPDWMGPDDLSIKIQELREATGGEIPVWIKIGATRVREDVKIAWKIGADAVFLDGMEGGTAASPEFLMEHTGIPTLAAIVEAREALLEVGAYGKMQIIAAGGIKSGVDAAKAYALGADCVAIGTAALLALGCNRPAYVEDYRRLGTEPYACHHCHTGLCPVGITTHVPELEARLDLDAATEQVTNFLNAMRLEMTILAKSCGKSHVLNMEPEDLRALTIEAAAMARVPLAGTSWVPGA